MRKQDLEAELKNAELRASQNAELQRQEQEKNAILLATLDAKYEDLEPRIDPDYGHSVYHRNQKRRTVVEAALQTIVVWCARNLGYNYSEDAGTAESEREATGLGLLAHMHVLSPAQAVLFAAEVCEQENWHGVAQRLLHLHETMSQPYANSRHEATSVTWWAE
jgi:hypothetical protein